jgi:methionyl aminopeptidase
VPSFKGYRGFPATLCTSRNHEIVHGIPSADVVLEEGDVISIDCGAIVEGFHGDSATTLIVGGDGPRRSEVRDLVTRDAHALWRGLEQVRTATGSATSARRSRRSPASTATAWCASTSVTASAGAARGPVGAQLRHGRAGHEDDPGWVIAVEPMFNLGTAETRTLDDGWTVVTADGSLSAHWEHTVAVTPDGPWVLTARSTSRPTRSTPARRSRLTCGDAGRDRSRRRAAGARVAAARHGGTLAGALPRGRASSRPDTGPTSVECRSADHLVVRDRAPLTRTVRPTSSDAPLADAPTGCATAPTDPEAV